MKIGVVQFGNGEIEKDGSVAGAVEVLGLTSDMGKVKKAIEGMNFLKGFTNMAQAFTSAEKLFPEAFSPSATMMEEESMGYMLIRENGSCGERGELLSSEVTSAEDCAALAEGHGVSAFSLGIKYARGRCFAEKLEVTEDMIADFNKDRANPPCPGGEWKKDGLYDFYALEPIVA